MRKPKDDCYSIPPTNRLHYILVKVSTRTWVVAEFNGHTPLPPTEDVPGLKTDQGCTMWQHGLEFEVVSTPLSWFGAMRHMRELMSKRIKERPIILSNEEI